MFGFKQASVMKDGQRYHFGKGEEVPFSSNLFHFLFDQVCTSTDILTNGLKELLKLLFLLFGLLGYLCFFNLDVMKNTSGFIH